MIGREGFFLENPYLNDEKHECIPFGVIVAATECPEIPVKNI